MVMVYHSFVLDDCISATILSMCVNIFFAVNGFLMLRKERDIKYLATKNAKLLFVYIIWILIDCYIYHIKIGEQIGIKELFGKAFILPNIVGDLWFIKVLFILNILYVVLVKVVKDSKSLWVTFCVFAFSTLMYFDSLFGSWTPFKFAHNSCLVYYLGGFLLLTNRVKVSYKFASCSFLFSFLIQAFLNYRGMKNGDLYAVRIFNTYSSPFVFVMTMCLIHIVSKFITKEVKIVRMIAENTLGVYTLQIVGYKLWNYFEIGNLFYLKPIIMLFLCCVLSHLLKKCKVTRFLVSI